MSDAPIGQATDLSPVKRALLAVDDMKRRLDAVENARTEPIAIVGIGCRFPGASGAGAYWELLRNGVDAVREVPETRWRIDDYFDADPAAPGKMYTRRAGMLDQVDAFEPQFFGIAPREAVGMDPQQRLLLEVCWEALEDAGQAPDRLQGTPTGVYVGIVTSDYATLQLKRDDVTRLDAYSQSGLAFSIASGRVSYVLGLQGPCMSLDTACSSSLVAVHLACQALRLGECRMALAGGVHLILLPDNSICYSRARMLSPDGQCKTFDAAADGFVEGEGCGVVVLKRLSDALADNDRIVAVIRGSAVNQDGPSGGLTVPNGPSQAAVIRDACARAGIAPSRIGYVEAHGTGTSLGDPIEMQALGSVLGEGRAAGERVPVGSVKTNLGHLQSASGIAGLIKVALSLQHAQIPPHLHFHTPSPHIPWSQLPLTVPTELTPWTATANPRVGSVSAFGFSGTNAHVVLEEAPPARVKPAAFERPVQLVTLSARSETALTTLADRWATAITRLPEDEFPNIAFTANTGRAHLPYRLAVAAQSRDEAAAALRTLGAGQTTPVGARGMAPSDPPKIAFLFTGQGSQTHGMARQLFDTQPAFRAALERCDALLRPRLPQSILSVLYGADDAAIHQTVYTQPVLFAVEYALAELWRSWGVVPAAVLGHSLGEYVAACVAGVFTLEQALELVALRAQLMQSLPAGGAMAAVLADEDEVRTIVAAHPQLSIAAINGPRQSVISGPAHAIDAAIAEFRLRDISCQPLNVSHAFHSVLMEPILDRFEEAVRRVDPRTPQLLLASNLTGTAARRELTSPSYWRRHLRETVRFADGVTTLHAGGFRTFIEIGPSAALCGMAQRVLRDEGAYLPSLRQGRGDWEQMLSALRELYVRGVPIDWDGFDRGYARRRVALPTYPFERARYWVEDAAARPSRLDARAHPLLGTALRTARGETIFDGTVNTDTLPYLLDHRKHGATLFPATAYLEMGLAAADEAFGTGAHAFEDLMISDPLVLPSGADVDVQVIVTPDGPDAARFELFSRSPNDEWRRHATGVLRKERATTPAATAPEQLRRDCPSPCDIQEYYATMRRDGHEFGPSFQVIRDLSRGQQLAAARLELGAAEAADARRYLVHPALLDGATQIIGSAVAGGELGEGETYLPVTLERLTVYRRGVSTGWGKVELRQADARTRSLAADVTLVDDDGQVVAAIEGLYLKPIRRDAIDGAGTANTDWLHEIVWIESPSGPAEPSPGHTWVVFGDGADAAAVCQRLRDQGQQCIRLARSAGDGSTEDVAIADPLDREALVETYRRAVADRTIRHAVYMWPLEAVAPAASAQSLMPAGVGGPGELLHVVQAITAQHANEPPRLSIVSRGAQAVAGSGRSVEQAAVVTLARTISAEYPELRCRCIDLPPIDDGYEEDGWAHELWNDDHEDLVAYRNGARHVARLRQQPHVPDPTPATAVALHVANRGMLETLALRSEPRRAPQDGEVEVRVEAVGLNFRDVLNALGMYEGPAGPLGSEFVGTIVAKGTDVALAVGQRVMGMAAGALRSHLTVAVCDIAVVPPAVTATEAATLPIVFLTALHALERLAQLRRGERVLIHAAAGGVGLAAIQVAQRIGAEIYATAGSDRKRRYLRSLGVQHIFNSRSTDFADQIRAATDGRGVDVVLNSLNGDFIPATVSALATGARFVEIGKAGIWTAEQMASVRPDVQYHTLYLGDLSADAIQRLFADLAAGLSSGDFQPLRHRTFALADAEQAFRFMAQARHIGKLVIDVDIFDAPPVVADATYVVTGAFGGLGRQVARWLVDRGARHLLLIGRKGAQSRGGGELVADLERRGATVHAAAIDIADSEAVEGALAAAGIAAPIRGVIHAAGVLDDGVLSQMTIERFNTVFAPKVAGAWHLHEHTRRLHLDFFVLFSSMVTVVGAPGQGNYAAANGVLDALAEYRRARGLPATTINWGPWADAGMSASVSEQDRQRWQHQGITMIRAQQGLALLDKLLRRSRAQAAVLPIQWRVLFQQSTAGAIPRLFDELAKRYRGAVPDAGVDLKAELEHTPATRRHQVVLMRVGALAHTVLGLDGKTPFDPLRPLQEYGLDSLMAVELRNSIGGLIGHTLPATLLFKYPTLQALAGFVLESMALPADATAVAVATDGDAEAAAVGSLSEEDVRRLLAEELQALSPGAFGES